MKFLTKIILNRYYILEREENTFLEDPEMAELTISLQHSYIPFVLIILLKEVFDYFSGKLNR